MKMFIDDNGFPVAELGRENQVLADFLMGDVQGSLYGVQEFIDVCDLVERGLRNGRAPGMLTR
jgi:hypothetical protein